MATDNIIVLFKNTDLLVVSKPPHISVHNDEDPTNLMKLISKNEKNLQLFPVHRLDKETSGIQIFALNTKSAGHYAKEFENRNTQKKYVGVLRGQIKDTQGVWNSSLTDKSEGRKNPQGAATQRVACETRFNATQKNSYFSLCEFDLVTGRQHQIRKHCALARHHLVGDQRYGDEKYNQKIFKLYDVKRMFLHCNEITIAGHVFKSEPPDEFKKLFGESL